MSAAAALEPVATLNRPRFTLAEREGLREAAALPRTRRQRQLDNLAATEAAVDIFGDRLPAKPYNTDDLAWGCRVSPQRFAIRRRYIQVNKPWLLCFLVLDVDHQDAYKRWHVAGLPRPYWIAVNRENGHAHLCWLLRVPVAMHDLSRPAPMSFLEDVQRGMVAQIGADENYGGLLTKNPTHRHWIVLTGGPELELAELRRCLPRRLPRRARGEPPSGVGRNVDTFNATRTHAYRAVRDYWRSQHGFVRFQAHLDHHALDFTSQAHAVPLCDGECYHIAKSVARWVWRRFSPEAFSALQAQRGRKAGRLSGDARREATRTRDRNIAFLYQHGNASLAELGAKFGLTKQGVAYIVERERSGGVK